MKLISLKTVFEDQRGKMESVFLGKPWEEINKVTSKKGSTRGGHYHKETEELIFILEGKVELEITNIKTKKNEKIILKKDQGVFIEPYELHTFKMLENTVWFGFLGKSYDQDNPDIFS